MIRLLERVLDRWWTVYVACTATLAIGLFFIFVRAPHPWGTEGFDHYHELALTLASGHTFPTMDVPWGYAYFLAGFYRLFGNRPAIPLTAQVLLNALMPLLVFRLGIRWFDRRTAVLAALLTGVFSFNTVYASTQSSDAVCTVIFTAGILTFARALAAGGVGWYALAGALTGLASQFRPNLILIPLLLAAYASVRARGHRAMAPLMLVLCATAALTPWIVRNYNLTRMLVPTSVHSGAQLWYGSLQVGRYLNSRAYNPRALFESGVFDYTSIDQLPLVVTAHVPDCAPGLPEEASLVYWTNRDATPRTAHPVVDGRSLIFEAPVPSSPGVFYYYVSASWRAAAPYVRSVPPVSAAPAVYFVSQDHFGDLDLNDDLLDLFDLVRVIRHLAWGEPAPTIDAGRGGESALESVVGTLAQRFEPSGRISGPFVLTFVHNDRDAVLTLADHSTITVPRVWHRHVTDLGLSGGLAASLMSSTVPLARPPSATAWPAQESCVGLDEVEINRVFYRREPHMMRRYTALAFDNIRRDPFAFVMATAFRAVRLFIVWGSGDRYTTQQFERGRAVSAMATVLSVLFVSLCIFGAVVSWRQGRPVLLPLLLILYIPATIAPMLTNMRYTITVQPLMFMFIAAGLTTQLERRQSAAVPSAGHDLAGIRTALRP